MTTARKTFVCKKEEYQQLPHPNDQINMSSCLTSLLSYMRVLWSFISPTGLLELDEIVHGSAEIAPES